MLASIATWLPTASQKNALWGFSWTRVARFNPLWVSAWSTSPGLWSVWIWSRSTRTYFILHRITRRMYCFVDWGLAGFFASVLARGIQISGKKCRQDNELDLVREFPCICRLYLNSFPFLISKPKHSFFEGAHFDFQAESIRMRDDCLLRLGSMQLLKVRAEF